MVDLSQQKATYASVRSTSLSCQLRCQTSRRFLHATWSLLHLQTLFVSTREKRCVSWFNMFAGLPRQHVSRGKDTPIEHRGKFFASSTYFLTDRADHHLLACKRASLQTSKLHNIQAYSSCKTIDIHLVVKFKKVQLTSE